MHPSTIVMRTSTKVMRSSKNVMRPSMTVMHSSTKVTRPSSKVNLNFRFPWFSALPPRFPMKRNSSLGVPLVAFRRSCDQRGAHVLWSASCSKFRARKPQHQWEGSPAAHCSNTLNH